MAEVAPSLESVPLVLMYHSVESYDADPFHVTVSPDRFAMQMRLLDRLGIQATSIGELLDLTAPPRDSARVRVGLTFDDGYEDFATEVIPVLAQYGFTATVFVVAGLLGGHNTWDRPGPRKALMTAEQLRKAAEAGMEIASHSVLHPSLPSITDQALADEVERSRAILQDVTGQPIVGFSYPYDQFGARELEAVQAAGYDYACAVAASPFSGRYALPRTYVGDRDSSLRLFAKWVRYRLGRGAVVR